MQEFNQEQDDLPPTQASDSVWTKILSSTGGFGTWKDDPTIRTNLYRKLRHFSPSHRNSAEHVEVIMYSLARGHALMRAAMEWESPFVGAVPTSPQSASAVRGVQWRLVMAYNAFEIVCVALKNHRGGLSHQMIIDFVKACELGVYPSPLIPPQRDRAGLKKWLESSVPTSLAGDALIDFLGFGREDAKAVRDWIVTESPIDTWYRAVMIAKALRNASAHGSLSATKVASFGLREAVEVLPNNLCEVFVAALKKLV